MKNVPCLAAITLLFGASFVASARADDSISQAPDPSENLSLQDPDGTPLAYNHDKPPTQAQIDAAKKRAQAAAADKDWLLKGYEKQLQLRAAKEPGSEDNNLYYRISSDKDLSRAAGVSSLDSTSTDTSKALRTGASNSDNAAIALRADSSAPAKNTSVVAPSTLFKPLVTPLGAMDAAGLHNFYGSGASAPAPVSKPVDAGQDPADLDMPGQIAAKSDPLTKDSLTFDTVPDDALPDKPTHHDNGSQPMLPQGSNAAQLQKINDTALNVPGVVKTVQPTNNLAALQLKLANDPPPPTKLTAPSPVRPSISSPYSILDR